MNEMCISDTTYGYNGDGTPPDKIVFVNDDGHTTYVPERENRGRAMSRPPIANDLREYADYLKKDGEVTDYYILTNIADEIDAEHRRRMYQQSRDIRKAACKYLASVIEDYKCGRKRKRN